MFGLIQSRAHQFKPTRAPYQAVRIGLFSLCVITVLTASFFWREKASAALSASAKAQSSSNAGLRQNSTARPAIKSNGPLSHIGGLSFMPMAADETIEVFAADCTTPKSSFELGEVVCVKVTSAPVSSTVLRRFSWSTHARSTVRTTDIVTSTQTDTFTLPSTAFSTIGTQVVDNRAVWKVATIDTSDNSLRSAVVFTVHDPAAPSADLAVSQGSNQTSDGVTADSDVIFDAIVLNNGPDAAQGVTLVNSFPPHTTFVSVSETAGPSFTCTTEAGVTSCVADAAFNPGDKALFRFTYHVSAGTATGTVITNEVTVAGVTAEVDSNDNDSMYNIPVTVSGTAPSDCSITCPADISKPADTTDGSGNPGAIVHFDAATSTGDCGTVAADHCNDCFFPVGTTLVTFGGNGDTCTFSVNIISPSAPTISCPPNKTGNADANCAFVVNLGNPTVSGGQNNTVFVSRSDGLPMYDCDVNGENCVRKSTDLPFPAGTTTVTWTAYSHDTPGPYANSDDEEAHRSGSASCAQTVTVYDVTPPAISATSSTVSADANCQAVVPDYSTTVSDNCACTSSDASSDCANHGTVTITQNPAPGTVVGLGATQVQITADDGADSPGPDGIIGTPDDIHGNVSTKTVTLTVVDTTPPTFTFVPPTVIAYTGPGATTCDTVISDAVLGTATATDNCGTVTITRSPSGNTFPVGNTTVVWKATDGAGNFTTASQTVTVIDNTPPVITTNGNTPSMWPPNHKYQTFTVPNFVSSVFDNCGGVSVSNVVIDHVTSDETENGNGDGNTLNDIVIGSDCKSVQLRSERDGGGNGRVYTITFRLTDTHGNTSTATAKVVVAHNPGETPVDSGVHYTVNGGCP
jgi:uncharacterized repeat protein (TIGR01451 family)